MVFKAFCSLVVKTLNYNARVFVFSDRECSSSDALQICILDSILDISISTIIWGLLIFFFLGEGREGLLCGFVGVFFSC